MDVPWNKFSYQKLSDSFASLDCKLVTTKDELGDKPPSSTKVTIIARCGHERIIAWNSFSQIAYPNCVNCNNKIGRVNQAKAQRFTYEEFCERLESHGCKLLMSEEEYYERKIRVIDEITFLASCGHPRTNSYENMYSSKEWKCKKCIYRQDGQNKKKNGKIDGASITSVLERQSLQYLTEILTQFKVVKMHEGLPYIELFF